MDSTARDTTSSPLSAATVNLVLFDENDTRGTQLHESLLGQLPGVQAHRVRSDEEAVRVLQAKPMDAIIVSCTAGEGGTQTDRVRGWARGIPVVAYETSPQVENATAFVAMEVDGNDPVSLLRVILDVVKHRPHARSANGMHTASGEPLDYQQVRSALLRVSHDINNPLSIISGNAQLLLELARAMGLDDGLVQPMRDIEEASRRASSLLRWLVDFAAQLEPPAPKTSP